jgi:signal transduction histidine kinase
LKTYNKEFYIGLTVWLLGVVSGYGMWLGDTRISIPFEASLVNILIVGALYLLFLLGHLITHGFFSFISGSRRVRIVGVILSSLAVLGLTLCLFFAIVALFSTLIVTQLAQYIDKKKAYLLAVLVPCLGIAIDLFYGRTLDYPVVSYPVILIYGTFNILALLAHFHLIDEQKLKDETLLLLRELKATQSLLKATTERNERIRIARDLHDSLGHQLTALSLQLEVASHIDDDAKDIHLEQAKKISKSLLSDIRETVSDIRRKDDRELAVALRALVTGIPNLEVSLEMNLDESCVDATQVEVIFRSVQEALTNVAKHSKADRCQISLNNDSAFINIDIMDNGEKVEAIEPGNGLKGMAERINNMGGELMYLSRKCGFYIRIRLPISHELESVFGDTLHSKRYL